MFAVIFEVQPRRERWDDYLAFARSLRPRLEAIDGFIDNERFTSLRAEGHLLSLSTWRDEKALIRWRTQPDHHLAQEAGRREIFADYHLRVGEVAADTRPPQGTALARHRFDETESGPAKAVTVTELDPDPDFSDASGRESLPQRLGLARHQAGLAGHELFESITTPGKLLLLASWRDAAAAEAWTPAAPHRGAALRHRQVRIIRDYGMFERREAPQFYPDAVRSPQD